MIEWQWLPFERLSTADLYELLALRQNVFILEQRCFYPDLDGLDQGAHHLLGWQSVDGRRKLAAYLRCIAPGVKFEEMSLGRVLCAPEARGGGLGRALMEQGIGLAELQYPAHRIRIGAQRYLEAFYASLGFASVSEPYVEDGIEHVDMLR